MSDQQTRAVLEKWFARSDSDKRLLEDLERLGSRAFDAICELISTGDLTEKLQRRALVGLMVATKYGGPEERKRLLEVALERATSENVSLRTYAAHVAVGSIDALATLWGTKRSDAANRDLDRLRRRVALTVRQSLAMGLQPPTGKLVLEFLSKTERLGGPTPNG